MACCNVPKTDTVKLESRSAAGIPYLVTPSTAPPNDAGAESFADLVDRTLTDVRQVLVSEHLRRLNMNDSFATDTGSKLPWDILPASQPLISEHLLLTEDVATSEARKWDILPASQPLISEHSLLTEDVVTSQTSDCGTQTQVDWNWPAMQPAMPVTWRPPDAHCQPVMKLQPCQSHEILREVSKQKLVLENQNRVFGSMNSEDLKLRNEEQALRIAQEVSAFAWKRMLVRSRKAPWEMMDLAMGIFIIANAITIGISCDTKGWERGWLVVDSVFAGFFVMDLLLRIYFIGPFGYFFGLDFLWAWFETTLVILSLVEIALTVLLSGSSTDLRGSAILRVIRLLRLVKILRVCRVPQASDLVMMVTGIIGGSRTLLSALFLVLFPLYVFALVMRETLGEEQSTGRSATSFNTLPKSCFVTFRCLVVEDCADEMGRPIFVLIAENHGWFYSTMYCIALFFLKFGLYNVIVAIFVEQTVQAAKYNATYQKRARLNDRMMFKEKSLEMAELAYSLKKHMPQDKVSFHLSLEEIQGLELSKDEFSDLCRHAEFKELLTALDVAEEDHLDLFDTLDVDGGGTLDLGEIVSGIAKLRGDARKSDAVAALLLARHHARNFHEFKEETADVLEAHTNQLSAIQNLLQQVFSGVPGTDHADSNADNGADGQELPIDPSVLDLVK